LYPAIHGYFLWVWASIPSTIFTYFLGCPCSTTHSFTYAFVEGVLAAYGGCSALWPRCGFVVVKREGFIGPPIDDPRLVSLGHIAISS
jgi:phosphate/sulfate permease